MRGRVVRTLALGGFALIGACEFFVRDDLATVLCSDEGAQGPPACPEGSTCIDGTCTDGVAPKPELGRRCTRDSDCADGDFCWDPRPFGDSSAIPVCSRPCCSSTQCDDVNRGFVCWSATAGGGSFCRRAGDVGRMELGSSDAGDSCLDGSYCRSGVCQDQHCVDVCCGDENCTASTGSEMCRLLTTPLTPLPSWVCAPSASALKSYLETCLSDAECASGLCVPIGQMKYCAKPCCGSEECGQLTVDGNPELVACDYVVHEGSLVRACSRLLPLEAVRPIGAECSLNTECRGGTCINTSGKTICSDVCCTDSSCGDPSFVCRPLAAGSSQALRCELK